MKDRSAFEELDVYQRAYAAALRVHEICSNFPDKERYGLVDQMRRASRSICANIAEGHGRRKASVAEFRRFLSMAVGSADEMQVWASFARDLSYVDAKTAYAMRQEYREIAAMLLGLGKAWSDGRAR